MISQIAADFTLLDVWRLPAQGGPDEFASLVEVMTSLDPTGGDSRITRALFWLRFRIGGLLGWDDAASSLPIPGRTETTLSARVPESLRDSLAPTEAASRSVGSASFIPLYRTDDEWAAELSNRTVHGVIHLAWVEQANGLYHGQMAVYVRPRGRLGAAYMAVIGPFRHVIVYPALMRQVARAWEARPDRRPTSHERSPGGAPDRPV